MALNAKLAEDKSGLALFLLVFLILTIPAAWWTGFVMLNLYNWFILPIHGAPVVSIGNMLGFSLILQLIAMSNSKTVSKVLDEAETWAEVAGDGIAKLIIPPAIFLFFGWIYQLIFMR